MIGTLLILAGLLGLVWLERRHRSHLAGQLAEVDRRLSTLQAHLALAQADLASMNKIITTWEAEGREVVPTAATAALWLSGHAALARTAQARADVAEAEREFDAMLGIR